MRAIFAGPRGRLLIALLLTELGGAVQSVAYASVLPIAATDLHGTSLYGATLAAGSFIEILVLAIGPAPFARLRPIALLSVASAVYVLGTALSVGAVAMPMMLVGAMVRGVAGGMLAGFGLSILGGLFQDRERTRAYGLFAMMWLLPSMLGPAVNAAVTIAWGWRAALAWPAILVLLGRALVGRHIGLVTWTRSTATRPSPGWAVALLGGLVLATVASLPPRSVGVVLLAAGCLLALAASLRVLQAQVGPDRARLARVRLLHLLCMCYFGGAGIVSLAAITGLGRGIVAGTSAVGAGLVGWSLTGFKPELADRWLRRPALVGLVLVTAGLLAALLTQTAMGGGAALVVLIGGWLVSGVGMGVAYPRFSATAMDDLPSDRVLPVATAIAFAETSATAIAGFVGGGTYALARSFALSPTSALGWSFALLTGLGVVSVALHGRSDASGPLRSPHLAEPTVTAPG